MNCLSSPRLSGAFAVVVLVAVTLSSMPLHVAAQQQVVSDRVAETVETPHTIEASFPSERLEVGDATRHLLTIQREGLAASPTPRRLSGDVASLSYQRYLDSFKYPIPERFNTTVQKTGNSR